MINTTKVRWTQAHLDELESNFPEYVDVNNTNELLSNVGKRTVVLYVKHRLLNQQTKANG